MPQPHHLSLVDPRLLAWLLEPQLLQASTAAAAACCEIACAVVWKQLQCIPPMKRPGRHMLSMDSPSTSSLQGGDKELSDYSLRELADRHLGGWPAAAAAFAPGGGGPDGAGPAAAAWAAATGGASGSGGGTAAVTLAPLQRMRRALEVGLALAESLHVRLAEARLPLETMQREQQVGGGGWVMPWCFQPAAL